MEIPWGTKPDRRQSSLYDVTAVRTIHALFRFDEYYSCGQFLFDVAWIWSPWRSGSRIIEPPEPIVDTPL